MASFVAGYFNNLVDMGGNQYFVNTGSATQQYTFVNPINSGATEFNIGDFIVGSNISGIPAVSGTYQGTYLDGIILYDESAGRHFYYSNQPIAGSQFIVADTTSFPVCFVKGTMIATPNGQVAIENLVPGDSVLGSTGWREVKWVGYRHYGKASFLNQEGRDRIAPVRIKAHALAENVPDKDLLTSPWHHVLVEGKLVRAGDLINGITIVQETHLTEVSYYHVELDQFDVVMAHGIYSESYADGGNRDFFQNADVTSLRPEDTIRRRASRPGFDDLVLRKGKVLVAIQKRVAQRAKDFSGIETKLQKAA